MMHNDTMMYGNTRANNGNMDDDTESMLRTTQIMDPDNINSNNETDNVTTPDNNDAMSFKPYSCILLSFVVLLCVF